MKKFLKVTRVLFLFISAVLFCTQSFIAPKEAQAQNYGTYILLSTYYTFPGQSVMVSGYRFFPDETVTITSSGASQIVQANSNGEFTNITLQLPSSAQGTNYPIQAIGDRGNRATASVSVGTYYPTVTPSSYYIIPGNQVSFSGRGFAPHEVLSISQGGVVLARVQSDTGGNFSSNYFSVGFNSTQQTYLFRGETSKITKSVTIHIAGLPSYMTLNNYYAQTGTPLLISGNFFGANEPIQVSFGNLNLGTAISDSFGRFSLQTTIPQNATGMIQIKATGLRTGASAQTIFLTAQTEYFPSYYY